MRKILREGERGRKQERYIKREGIRESQGREGLGRGERERGIEREKEDSDGRVGRDIYEREGERMRVETGERKSVGRERWKRGEREWREMLCIGLLCQVQIKERVH